MPPATELPIIVKHEPVAEPPQLSLEQLETLVDAYDRAEVAITDYHAQRDRNFKKTAAAFGGLATIGPLAVSGLLWFFNAGGRERERVLDQQHQRELTEAHSERLSKIERAVVENQVLMVESVDHLSAQLAKMDPAAATAPEPATLTQARDAAEEAKARRTLFED